MKFFPESLVPDPDKKFSITDKSLVNKIVESLVMENKDLLLINQTHEEFHNKGKYAGGLGDYIICKFLKKDKELNLVFQKISFFDKKDFDYDKPLMNSFWDCVNDKKLEPHVHEEVPGIQYLPKSEIKTKKLCGIKIAISKYKYTSFAVGSADTVYNDIPKENKLYKCAYQNLTLYIDWIKKNL